MNVVTNQLATSTKLQHWRAIRELTYLPKAFIRGGPSVLQLQLGNTVLGLAMHKYAAEIEGVELHPLAYATGLESVWDYIPQKTN